MTHPGAFCLYKTVDIDLSEILKTLNHGIFGDSNAGDQWYSSPQSFINRPLSSIVQHHRSQPESFNKKYFVVVDRAEWKAEGVIAVNLAYEGFIDAARLKANVAGSAIPSVSIGNTDWTEAITDVVKRPHFAVYADMWFDKGDAPDELLKALNSGMESRKDTALPVCDLAPHFVSTEDVGFVARGHAGVAAEGKYDPQLFLFADDVDVDEYGVVIGRMSADGDVDSCRKPVDVAAEVLTWVQVGLYTWQEAKEWDDEPQNIEQ